MAKKKTAANGQSPDVASDQLEESNDTDQKEKIGLSAWLQRQIKINAARDSDERQRIWQNAVADYLAAKTAVKERSACATALRQALVALQQIDHQMTDMQRSLDAIQQRRKEIQTQQHTVDATDGITHALALEQAQEALECHHGCKPTLWQTLCSLGRAYYRWNAKRSYLESQCNRAQRTVDRMGRQRKQFAQTADDLTRQARHERRQLHQLEMKRDGLYQAVLEQAKAARAVHLLAWLKNGTVTPTEAIELAEPWSIPDWRQARARVFLQALTLHQCFLMLEPKRMWTNLSFINSVLTGVPFRCQCHATIRSAWASLFMVVPVLSSTFSSFARTFASLGARDIGWLFVDEAGQAPPQAAVGALWRAERAVCVGDPLQLKPIVTVSDAVLEHMRTHYQVSSYWFPNRQSAQTLADQATPWGKSLGPNGQKTWVGLPLVVHRRCDRPMFEIANCIAYDGAMVYGTVAPPPAKETRARLPTGWIDVVGPSDGNWIAAEGDALRDLLKILQKEGVQRDEIAIITPFRDVLRQLMFTAWCKKFEPSTIHTMQGKEAEVIIFILGGNTAAAGARDWVVSAPNLLNVAVTRAKRRLYVIGDRTAWQRRNLFCDVMEWLPSLNARISRSAATPDHAASVCTQLVAD